MNQKDCPFCLTDGGHCLYRGEHLRIIAPKEEEFPGLIRVIWHQHIAEMTDLKPHERSHIMMTVCQVEDLVRQIMQPDKMNLAALGNQVPHLHWHIIPRWTNDRYFPLPIWGQKQRESVVLDHTLRQEKEKILCHAIEQRFVQEV